MSFRAPVVTACTLLACLLLAGTRPDAQRSGLFHGSANDPGIQYMSAPLDNPVDRLNRQLEAGTATLTFEGRSGYLRSTLDALGLPIESQMLVFSRGSLQARQITEDNPRAIFFRDDVQLGWVRGGDVIEVATQDARVGIVYYTLEQTKSAAPRFERGTLCLGCHMAGDTGGVPGLLMFSTSEPGRPFGAAEFMTQTTPAARRFGGWFVTGRSVPVAHMGNTAAALAGVRGPIDTTRGLYDPDGFVMHTSDIAALMTFAHQVHAVNALVRAAWEGRAADPAAHPGASPERAKVLAPVLAAVAADVVDSLLFIDEAPLDGKVVGSSGFAEHFASLGPKDGKGRSLRELDLTTRLMRYPCSYLIYSPMFDGLPSAMKDLVYQRLWEVLSGAERDPRYTKALSLADRQAVVEILRDTMRDLPAYFRPVTR
ncbi:MAG: hypothetical protein FJW23_09900 [Acidimicrobiia bacterium]|nr:hypothetical protein [Acidimicrobiia bacterium]